MTALAPSFFWKSGALWTPSTPGNLLAWWDANTGLSLTGSRVTAWNDQSGNGHHLSEFSGLGPTYAATGWNSAKPTVQFGGTNVFLRNVTTSIYSYPNGTGTPITIFATVNATTGSTGALLHWFEDPGVSDTYTFGILNSDALRVYDGATDHSGSAAATGRKRIAYTYDGSTLKGYVGSGTADFTVGSLSIVKAGLTRMYMGAIWNLTQKWQGDVSEVIVYSAALSAAHVASYVSYSNTKWAG